MPYDQRVFKVGSIAAVLGAHGPAVIVVVDFAHTAADKRFDGDDQALFETTAVVGIMIVGYVRSLVESAGDSIDILIGSVLL